MDNTVTENREQRQVTRHNSHKTQDTTHKRHNMAMADWFNNAIPGLQFPEAVPYIDAVMSLGSIALTELAIEIQARGQHRDDMSRQCWLQEIIQIGSKMKYAVLINSWPEQHFFRICLDQLKMWVKDARQCGAVLATIQPVLDSLNIIFNNVN